MANPYRKLDLEMWGDEKFQTLSPPAPSAQVLWIYLLTGPYTTIIPGVVPAGLREICGALRWPYDHNSAPPDYWAQVPVGQLYGYEQGAPDGRSAMEEILESGMAKMDAHARLIWLPKAIYRNPPASSKNVVSWETSWKLLPGCRLKAEIHDYFADYFKTRHKNLLKCFLDRCKRPKEERLVTLEKQRGKYQCSDQCSDQCSHQSWGKCSDGGIRSQRSVNRDQLTDNRSSKLSPPATLELPEGADDLCFEAPISSALFEAPAAKKNGQKKPSGDHQTFVAMFDERYTERYGGRPTWGAKQGAQVKRLLGSHGLEECARRLRVMFDSPPDWLKEPYDLGTLVQHFDKFVGCGMSTVERMMAEADELEKMGQ